MVEVWMEMKGRPETVGLKPVTRIRTKIPKAKVRFKLVKEIRFEISGLGTTPAGIGCTAFFRLFATISEIIIDKTVSPHRTTNGRAPPFFLSWPK